MDQFYNSDRLYFQADEANQSSSQPIIEKTQQGSYSPRNDGNPTHISITKSIETSKKSTSPTPVKLSLKHLGIIVKSSFLLLTALDFASVYETVFEMLDVDESGAIEEWIAIC